MTDTKTKNTALLLAEITEFLWREADHLDTRNYDAWLDMWEPEGLYIMPIGEGDDYKSQLNLCYDNDKMRRLRIDRFERGFSISSAPAADSIRSVSRIVIDSITDDTIKVRASEQVVESKFGRQRLWAADLHYELKQTKSGFVITQKVAKLLNSEGMLRSFSYLF